MTGGPRRTPASSSRARTPSAVLDALTTEERSAVLVTLVESHPELLDEAETEARKLLSAITVDDVAAGVSSALRLIPLEELGARAGRVRGRGYVHETDAAFELVEEAVEPFLAGMRRRASLGLAGPAAVVATGVVAGLYLIDPPDDGSVLAYAGLDVPGELADAVLDEADRLASPSTRRRQGSTGPGGTSSADRPAPSGSRATGLGRWRGERTPSTTELRGARRHGRRAAGGERTAAGAARVRQPCW